MNINKTRKTVVDAAKDIAYTQHKGQFRLGKPKRLYIVHPELVVDLITKFINKPSDALQAAAWLHDVIEDTDCNTPEKLKAKLHSHGNYKPEIVEEAVSLVMEMSMPEEVGKDEIRSHQIDKIATMTANARIIKIADQVANIHDALFHPIDGWNERDIHRYFCKAKDIVISCADTAPKIYALFAEAEKQRQSKSFVDWSALSTSAMQRHATENPIEHYDTIEEHSVIEITVPNSDIRAYGQSDQEVHVVHVSEDDRSSLVNFLRNKLEGKGYFLLTKPLEGKLRHRKLILSHPVPKKLFCEIVKEQ